MSVTTSLSEDEKTWTIYIDGDFNYYLLHEFTAAYQNIEELKNKMIVLDLRKTLTIDSSALGMILNMQKALEKPDRTISVINCNRMVKNIFEITNLDRKFNVR